MKSARFEYIMELERCGRTEDVIRESKILLTEGTDANEKASVLINMCVSYIKLTHLEEAQQTLHQLKRLNISQLGIRLNSEFCEPVLLIQQGRYEEGLAAFVSMIERNCQAFRDPEYRYLYEDIQCRRAMTMCQLTRYAEALPILREVVSFPFERATDEQQVHFALAVCLDDANEAEAAKHEFIHVVRLALKNEIEEKALWRLSILYYKAGAMAQAKQQLETLLRDFPSDSSVTPRRQIYEGLSRVYRYLHDETNAKHYADLATGA